MPLSPVQGWQQRSKGVAAVRRIYSTGGEPSIGIQMPQQALRIAAFFEQDRQIVMGIRVRRVDFQTSLIASLSVFFTSRILQSDCIVKVQHAIVREVNQRFVK